MAFAWTSVNDGSKITAAHWNEVKTNVDTIISNLGISAYSWSELPVSQSDDKVQSADLSELRAALDYAHDNNTCSAENSSEDSSDNALEYTTDDGDHDGTFNTTYDTTVEDADDTSADATADSGYDGTYYYSNETDQHANYYSTKYTGYGS